MAFSPLPRNYDEAINEINGWRAKYTREARKQEQRITELEAQLAEASELHMMQIAAISTAALSNSRNSEPPIVKEHPYWTPAYQDTVDAVRREMQQRERAEHAEAENAALRDDAERYRFIRKVNAFAIVEYCGMFGPKELKGKKLDKAIDAARKK